MSISNISGYAFTIKDFDKAKQLGIGGLWSAISSVQGGQDSDTVEIAHNCKGKAKEINKSFVGNLLEAVRIYVKVKFAQFTSALYDNTIGKVTQFGKGLVEKYTATDTLKTGLDNLGNELNTLIQKKAENTLGVNQADVDKIDVEQELAR